jgi:hypothetical protein
MGRRTGQAVLLIIAAACGRAAEPTSADAGDPAADAASVDSSVGNFGAAMEIDCSAKGPPDGGFAFTATLNGADSGMLLAYQQVACKCLRGADGGQGYFDVTFGTASSSLSLYALNPKGPIEPGRYTSYRPEGVDVRGKVRGPGRLYESAPGDKGSETLLLLEASDDKAITGSFRMFRLRVYEPQNVDEHVEVVPPVRATCRYP